MELLTTVRVREIIREFGGDPLYTNSATGNTGNIRRIKCYYRNNKKLLAALRAACGEENVTLTKGIFPAITVRCILEK